MLLPARITTKIRFSLRFLIRRLELGLCRLNHAAATAQILLLLLPTRDFDRPELLLLLLTSR